MKKILLGLLILFTSFTLFSCRKELENPVSLSSLTTTKETTKIKTTSKMGYKLDNETSSYQFVCLFNDEINFDLIINLDNPKDYHIFDFTLTCEDENAKVFIDNEYVLLSSLNSLNWRGATNTKYTLKMQVSSTEFVNTISLTSMYYSDRTDGSNKYDVNLNNKGNVDVYRLYNGVNVNIIDYNTINLTLNDEHIDTTSIKVNGVNCDIAKDFDVNSNHLKITYEYLINENQKYNGSQDFELPKIYLGYTTFPYVEINLNPIYLSQGETINVKIIDKKTNDILDEEIVANANHTFSVEFDITKYKFYFLINDTIAIGK